MQRNIVHILDIGSQNIKALAAERRGADGIHILGASIVPTEGVRRGIVNNPQLLSKKIRMAVEEVERFSGIPFKEAFLTFGTPALGASKIKARVAVAQASGEIGAYDVERVLAQARPSSRDLQNREILNTFGLNYSIDSEMIMHDPLGMKGENLEAEVLFITSLLKPLREMISAIEVAGVSIADVIPAPLASARAILTQRQREAGALVLDIGAETIDLAVMEENLPYSIAVFPFGGAHITNDIALGFQVSLDKAEEIKITCKLPDDNAKTKNKFANIVGARMEDMFELVENHLKKIGRQGLLPGGAVISGGSAKIGGIDDFARNALRLPASLSKFQDVDTGHKVQDPVWATAVGAALIALDQEGEPSKPFKSPSQLRQKIQAWLRSLIP